MTKNEIINDVINTQNFAAIFYGISIKVIKKVKKNY